MRALSLSCGSIVPISAGLNSHKFQVKTSERNLKSDLTDYFGKNLATEIVSSKFTTRSSDFASLFTPRCVAPSTHPCGATEDRRARLGVRRREKVGEEKKEANKKEVNARWPGCAAAARASLRALAPVRRLCPQFPRSILCDCTRAAAEGTRGGGLRLVHLDRAKPRRGPRRLSI
jgi:hypothetical protein